jgi:galactose oxidase-like protein
MKGRLAASRRVAGPMALGGLAFVSGCGLLLDIQPPSYTGPCNSNMDCPTSQLCVSALCQDSCTSTTECRSGEACTPVVGGAVCLVLADGRSPDATQGVDAFEGSVDGGSEVGPEAEAGAEGEGVLEASEGGEASSGADASDANDASDEGASEMDAGDVVVDGGSEADAPGCPASPVCGDAGCGSRVVLFGGNGPNGLLNDTWEWDGTQWTQRTPAQSPTPRFLASMAPSCGGMALFGGSGGSNPYLNDQWQWDGANWMPQQFASSQSDVASAPPVRNAAAFAALNGTAMLFGGYGDGATTTLGDTWVWDAGNWMAHQPSNAPPARAAAAAATLAGTVVVFGGDDGVSNTPLGDTWLWDGVTWRNATPAPSAPSPSVRIAAAAATLNGAIVLFGGSSDGITGLNDTWLWDGVSWTQKMPARSPTPRYRASAASLNGRVVLFGGSVAGGNAVAETWIWDGNNWTQLPVPGPSARYSGAMAGLSP